MKIKTLDIARLRAFEQTSFSFREGMNLIVGVNGVGKTTTLDALRICFSKILPEITDSRSKKLPFFKDDIKIGEKAMTISLTFEIENKDYSFLLHEQVEEFVEINNEEDDNELVSTPDHEEYNPPIEEVAKKLKSSKSQPLVVYYSTKRSIMTNKAPTSAASKGGIASAYSESLSENREFSLKEVAEWINVREELAKELAKYKEQIETLELAAKRFLPNCDNLKTITAPSPRLFIEKNGVEINVSKLSDGERGLLTIVLDLAKRLSYANPGLDNPIKNGKAIVLIDELDLHLHPQWQRMVVERLTTTFPNCQFIVSTHSPQIIPSVPAEKISLITEEGVIQPSQTLGMDTNWILRHLMGTSIRPKDSEEAIELVEDLINEGDFDGARFKIEQYKTEKNYYLPEWSVFEARMDRIEMLEEE